jgi:hypothetical protein
MKPFDANGWTILFYTDFQLHWADLCDFKHNLAETDNLCLTTPTTLTEKSIVLNQVHATFSKENRLP